MSRPPIRPVALALLRDAYAQVVDNMVFRVLGVLLAVLVLPTFLIRLGPEGLTILFAFELRYDQILPVIDAQDVGGETHVALIEGLQILIADKLAGSIGIFLCITAAAFFMPRMLEKGAADVVFSKPVSRLVLMLSRYAAGLIFVALLATALIGGMHLGFSLVSGHSLPGFLWSIPTLVYAFAIFHAFSIVAGVVTRSSVAAILLTMVFWMLNSCVHGSWEVKQAYGDSEAMAELGEQVDLEAEVPEPLRWIGGILDVAHYALPKTRDGRRIVELLRGERAAETEDGPDELDPWKIYARRFGWRAPLPYNAWLSLGTTLAFAALALALGWWRLARIDF